MKGVIFKVGEPKSIVLLNNRTFTSIDTPPDARVGMVVTVKNRVRPLLLFLIVLGAAFVLSGLIWGGMCAFGDAPTPFAVFQGCCRAAGGLFSH